jgi:hypothetical protein
VYWGWQQWTDRPIVCILGWWHESEKMYTLNKSCCCVSCKECHGPNLAVNLHETVKISVQKNWLLNFLKRNSYIWILWQDDWLPAETTQLHILHGRDSIFMLLFRKMDYAHFPNLEGFRNFQFHFANMKCRFPMAVLCSEFCLWAISGGSAD